MKKPRKFMSVTALLLAAVLLFTSCSSGSGEEDSSILGLLGRGSVTEDEPYELPVGEDGGDPITYGSGEDDAAPETAGIYDDASVFNGDAAQDSYSLQRKFIGEPMIIPEESSDEEYLIIEENDVKSVSDEPLLTFSLKVDTASYRNVVRYINSGDLPPSDAVRIEEMINYFKYDMVLEENNTPFSIYTELGKSPFDANKELAFVRVKSKSINRENLPKSNLTFLIDTSGSMSSADKLPLLKRSFELLVNELTEEDIVSIVTYSGSAAVLIDSVRGNRKDEILKAIEGLEAEGSTAGADGINTAYALAEKNFADNANNRVILATDGDFNVGVSSVEELERMMTEKRKNGIYISILGFGTENLKDNKMETIAKNGNGNYSYIDTLSEAKKILVEELGANLYTIADDVKAQIEFNPALVSSYRLIGYENRMLQNRDFEDDTKDAGEIGIGTDVVLMFELTRGNGIGLKYQASEQPAPEAYADELFEVKIRYKNPGESSSKLITEAVKLESFADFNSNDFNFAASAAAFGHLLKDSPHSGNITIEKVSAMAKDSIGNDKEGYRKEFVEILDEYKKIRN